MIYAFDDCELDLRRYELRRGGLARRIEPQVFDVLVMLVRERDRVVTKEEILDSVWGDRFVSESALTSRIKALRQALGDDGKAQRLVRTVRGRGYQFVAEVVEHGGRPTVAPTAVVTGDPPPQEIRFCTTDDGVRLAYATMGAGPPLVKVANWLSHLDYDRETVVWRHWLTELSRRHRLIRYDERGCGLSDWEVPDFSFAAWVRDLETVVDAAGLDRFPLLGISQGGPVAVAYAVRHPERVSHLVLLGAFARGRSRRATTREERELEAARSEIVRLGWGATRPAVPPDLRGPVPARGHPGGMARVRRAPAAVDVPGERVAVRPRVRRHRHHGHRPAGVGPHARRLRPQRTGQRLRTVAGAGLADSG